MAVPTDPTILLSNSLYWKYGGVADVFDGKIIAWRDLVNPQPDEATIQQIISDYLAAYPAIQAQADADAQANIDAYNQFSATLLGQGIDIDLLRKYLLSPPPGIIIKV